MEGVKKEKKSTLPPLTFKNPFFLSELQNQVKHLPKLLKPFILPPSPCYKRFLSFFLIYFGWIFKKT
jgi:hypothetical protein